MQRDLPLFAKCRFLVQDWNKSWVSGPPNFPGNFEFPGKFYYNPFAAGILPDFFQSQSIFFTPKATREGIGRAEWQSPFYFLTLFVTLPATMRLHRHSALQGKTMTQTETIAQILREASRIAVVGYSNKPYRAGHYVPAYLQDVGYEILPVNPFESAGLGQPVYPSLNEVPGSIDLVLIFRRPEEVPAVVEEAIQRGAQWVWMQLGAVDEAAARRAEEAGLGVVRDRCMMVEHRAWALFADL